MSNDNKQPVDETQAVKNAAKKAAAEAAKLGPKVGKVAERIVTILCIFLMLLPLIISITKLFTRTKKSLVVNGKHIVSIKSGDVEVKGEELLECAHEGLQERIRKANEKKEAEFDRRVATAVKKAMQGK